MTDQNITIRDIVEAIRQTRASDEMWALNSTLSTGTLSTDNSPRITMTSTPSGLSGSTFDWTQLCEDDIIEEDEIEDEEVESINIFKRK